MCHCTCLSPFCSLCVGQHATDEATYLISQADKDGDGRVSVLFVHVLCMCLMSWCLSVLGSVYAFSACLCCIVPLYTCMCTYVCITCMCTTCVCVLRVCVLHVCVLRVCVHICHV